MKKHALLKAGAATAVIALTVSAPAYAQDADVTTETAAEEPGQAIVVTGTRLRSPNLESASPVTVVTAEEFALTGTTRVEDLINSLPQVFASQSSTLSNGASGTATVDLRGLGSQRTLVLIGGRRLMPGDVVRLTILGCGSSPGVPRITGDWGQCDPDNPKNRRRRASALVERPRQ